VPLTADNVMHLARAVLERKLRQPARAARHLVRRIPGAARLRRAAVKRQLRSSPLFAHVDTQALEALAARAEELALPPGQSVCRKGDTRGANLALAPASRP
jgi:hypothetical protein